MRSSGSLISSLALGLFVVYLAVATPWALLKAARSALLSFRVAGETPLEERLRTYGPMYSNGIEKIRRTIPENGAYLLINGDPKEEGGPLWVKFDLAPRRAVFLGKLDEIDDADRLRKRIPRAARWVVIAYGPYGQPELIERFRFVKRIQEQQGKRARPDRPGRRDQPGA